MQKNRLHRVNSLLREVISDIILKEVRNPHVQSIVSITRVDVSADLHHAKVFINMIGSEAAKQETLVALQTSAGFIGILAAKQVTLRYFPQLTFYFDDAWEKQLHMDELIHKVQEERRSRSTDEDLTESDNGSSDGDD